MKLQFVAVLFLWTAIGYGQETTSPFKLKKNTEVVLLSTAIGSSIIGYSLTRSLRPLSHVEIDALDATDIWAPDRGATNFYSSRARNLSDIGLASAFSMSLVILSKHSPNTEYSKLFVIGAETAFYTIGLTLVTKAIAKRARPYAYNELVSESKQTSKDARQSFFSGHTSIASAACFFTAQTAYQYNFSARSKKLIWATAISLPAFVGTMRVLGGKHFPSDVITGYAVGAVLGCGIPYLHQQKSSSFSFQPGFNSLHISYKF